ncbi:glycoside hydrolase [Setomelanomma holmii]|uniref:Glycoside hydrolase n=1 Tax=Setomelanomma holmii TaxID=210430 RepID=A0A9P4GWS2_9PLEO|nr:glycoside hydrolase [Setomelanomma holmii]
MPTLIPIGFYTEQELFYSTNLQHVSPDQFRVPSLYRTEGVCGPSSDALKYCTLRTNGISSRANIYLSGHLIADKDIQAGAYVGLEYDVTDFVTSNQSNVLLVECFPTDCNRDFALGFVDWNLYPPDNGTGMWRNIEMKRTGQVSLSMPRITTTLDGSIYAFLDIKNLAKNESASGYLDCIVHDPQGYRTSAPKSGFDLTPSEKMKLEVKAKLNRPQIWWPQQWGDQPLYSVQCNASTRGQDGISDHTADTKFGIRTISSRLNTTHNDTTFYVNSERFQVLGAGYTSDIFLHMGLNTIRLQGKQEQPRLYELADEMGIMLLAGWECCDKWEGWSCNDEGIGEKWSDADYSIVNLSMRHEAEMMQSHPSMLGFLIGNDFWPDDRATKIYVDALKAFDWNVPILASASQRGAPALIGNGNMKMDGPYDWATPNHWYDSQQRLGSAGGFGSELGAGVGTPEIGSLPPNKGLYHMSTNASSLYTRQIYNDALWAQYGAPTNLVSYLLDVQMMDYEATKSQFEVYTSRWSSSLARPVTGMIYWMLNNAWPSLHWNLFDYYLHPSGSYYRAKATISKLEHVIFDYQDQSVYVIDRRLAPNAPEDKDRTVDIEVMVLDGKMIVRRSVEMSTEINCARKITDVPGLANMTDVVFLRLLLNNYDCLLSRSVYWLAPTLDVLDWDNSTWCHTPVTTYSNFQSLNAMPKANITVSVLGNNVKLENKSKIPAVFVRLNLVDAKGEDVVPVTWSENYVTLWPGEKMDIEVGYGDVGGGVRIEVDGKNVERQVVQDGGYGS